MDRAKLIDYVVAGLITFVICTVIVFSAKIFKSNPNMKNTNIDGYVYDTNTKIIYIESKSSEFFKSYTEYYNENGNLCRYNILNDEFEEIIKGE